MRVIDISRTLEKGVPVWPGDTKFSFGLTWTKEDSGSVNVGQITMSAHTGTHIDAPFHFTDDGSKTAELDLDPYLGPAQVIDLSAEESVGARELRRYSLEGISRLLFYTGSWPDRSVFPERITHLRPDAAPFLSEKGIRLVGVDTPSVDPLDSKEMLTHHALLENSIHILEGALLDHVEPGDYELAALPLALNEADASPVRAVLRALSA